jgi:glycosyltransferase involved in cell wall biosynthesis
VSNKKKILYVVNVDWFFISHRLPLALEAIRLNYDVFLVTRNSGRFKELEALGICCINVKFDRSKINPIKEISIIRQLIKIYSSLSPNIIHHVTLKSSLYGTLAYRMTRLNCTIINAVSGLGYTFTAERNSLGKFLLLKLMRFVYHKKDTKFIFQNPDDKKLYEELGFLTETNFIIIKGSGVDEKIFTPKINREKTKFKVIFLARMIKDKGLFEFISAAELLREKYSDKVEFNLVGGIDLNNLAAISEYEINIKCDGKYIKWLGHISEVKEVYQDADIVCLPSYREGLPKSLVEAMACGCPIITTNAIGCRECVDENYNGFLVPIGDYELLASRIIKLYENEDLRVSMGKNSRIKMIKEMSLNEVVLNTFKFYE